LAGACPSPSRTRGRGWGQGGQRRRAPVDQAVFHALHVVDGAPQVGARVGVRDAHLARRDGRAGRCGGAFARRPRPRRGGAARCGRACSRRPAGGSDISACGSPAAAQGTAQQRTAACARARARRRPKQSPRPAARPPRPPARPSSCPAAAPRGWGCTSSAPGSPAAAAACRCGAAGR
jgi:hypothetical protein